MVSSSPLGEYLRARRAALRPEDVGMVSMGLRRVEGLRRDEVAQLCGVSEDYYLRIEQGRDRQPSEQVLYALARGLRLDYSAVQYMKRLVSMQQTGTGFSEPRNVTDAVDKALRSLLDQWASTPAFIVDRNHTVLMANPLASALFPGIEQGGNIPMIVFSDEWRSIDQDWDHTARATVAALRFSSDPGDTSLRQIVGMLTIRDRDFARMWALHEASPNYVGRARLSLTGFGTVEFTKQSLLVPGGRGHIMTVLQAEPDSAAADVIRATTAHLPALHSAASDHREVVSA
jgi:transcriptional regulator with XRE-family HTH domain